MARSIAQALRRGEQDGDELAAMIATFPAGRVRTRAVAYYGAVAGVGASLGLVLGGLLTSWVSWRVGFFINVPIGTAGWGSPLTIAALAGGVVLLAFLVLNEWRAAAGHVAAAVREP